jgi:hypothetical protein
MSEQGRTPSFTANEPGDTGSLPDYRNLPQFMPMNVVGNHNAAQDTTPPDSSDTTASVPSGGGPPHQPPPPDPPLPQVDPGQAIPLPAADGVHSPSTAYASLPNPLIPDKGSSGDTDFSIIPPPNPGGPLPSAPPHPAPDEVQVYTGGDLLEALMSGDMVIEDLQHEDYVLIQEYITVNGADQDTLLYLHLNNLTHLAAFSTAKVHVPPALVTAPPAANSPSDAIARMFPPLVEPMVHGPPAPPSDAKPPSYRASTAAGEPNHPTPSAPPHPRCRCRDSGTSVRTRLLSFRMYPPCPLAMNQHLPHPRAQCGT